MFDSFLTGIEELVCCTFHTSECQVPVFEDKPQYGNVSHLPEAALGLFSKLWKLAKEAASYNLPAHNGALYGTAIKIQYISLPEMLTYPDGESTRHMTLIHVQMDSFADLVVDMHSDLRRSSSFMKQGNW